MATDRSNPDSWQSDHNRFKEFRESKDGPEITGGPRRKKDKNRWCKGKVGREHDYTKLIPSRWSSRDIFYVLDLVCSKCHKVEDYRYQYDAKGNKEKRFKWMTYKDDE